MGAHGPLCGAAPRGHSDPQHLWAPESSQPSSRRSCIYCGTPQSGVWARQDTCLEHGHHHLPHSPAHQGAHQTGTGLLYTAGTSQHRVTQTLAANITTPATSPSDTVPHHPHPHQPWSHTRPAQCHRPRSHTSPSPPQQPGCPSSECQPLTTFSSHGKQLLSQRQEDTEGKLGRGEMVIAEAQEPQQKPKHSDFSPRALSLASSIALKIVAIKLLNASIC